MNLMVTCLDHRRRVAQVETKPTVKALPAVVIIDGQTVKGYAFPVDGLCFIFK